MGKYEDILYKLCLKSYNRGEIPVACLIVKDNRIIAKAYNKKNLKHNALLHCEIICLQKAYKKLKRWNLNDCELYVTLEPCDMCKELISESRINKVYYILCKSNVNNKYNKVIYEQTYACENSKFDKIMKSFFKKLRK